MDDWVLQHCSMKYFPREENLGISQKNDLIGLKMYWACAQSGLKILKRTWIKNPFSRTLETQVKIKNTLRNGSWNRCWPKIYTWYLFNYRMFIILFIIVRLLAQTCFQAFEKMPTFSFYKRPFSNRWRVYHVLQKGDYQNFTTDKSSPNL